MNINEWAGARYPQHIVTEAISWLGYLDSFVDAQSLKGEDATTEIIEQSVFKLNDSKRIEFFEWLGKDPRHQYLFADCCELWAKTACLQSLKTLLGQSNILAFPHNTPKPTLKISSLINEVYSPAPAAPVWAYKVVISLIIVGLSLPIIA